MQTRDYAHSASGSHPARFTANSLPPGEARAVQLGELPMKSPLRLMLTLTAGIVTAHAFAAPAAAPADAQAAHEAAVENVRATLAQGARAAGTGSAKRSKAMGNNV